MHKAGNRPVSMTFANHPAPNSNAKALRKAAGAYLRELRQDRRLTQRELAERVGLDYYTFVSQIEGGSARVPFADLPKWAAALGVEKHELARALLRLYDPSLHSALFD